MDKRIRIGMDTSKSVFVLHGVNAAERPVLRKRLRRRQVIEFFAKLPSTQVGMEACGGAHHWVPACAGTNGKSITARLPRNGH